MIGIAFGVAIMALSKTVTGNESPWLGEIMYYLITLFVLGFISALPSPQQWWKGTLGIFIG